MRSTNVHRLVVLASLLVAGGGCSTFRPAANSGHDLLENSGWPLWSRIPAGIGAAGGYLLAIPFSVVLLPSLPFESAAVESAQGYGKQEERGDLYIPLAGAPYEYCGGVGASVLGWPFERLACAVGDAPGPPPGTVEESAENPPGTADPELDFTVRLP